MQMRCVASKRLVHQTIWIFECTPVEGVEVDLQYDAIQYDICSGVSVLICDTYANRTGNSIFCLIRLLCLIFAARDSMKGEFLQLSMYSLSTLYERFLWPGDIRFWSKLEDKKTTQNMRYQIFPHYGGSRCMLAPVSDPKIVVHSSNVQCREELMRKTRGLF